MPGDSARCALIALAGLSLDWQFRCVYLCESVVPVERAPHADPIPLALQGCYSTDRPLHGRQAPARTILGLFQDIVHPLLETETPLHGLDVPGACATSV